MELLQQQSRQISRQCGLRLLGGNFTQQRLGRPCLAGALADNNLIVEENFSVSVPWQPNATDSYMDLENVYRTERNSICRIQDFYARMRALLSLDDHARKQEKVGKTWSPAKHARS